MGKGKIIVSIFLLVAVLLVVFASAHQAQTQGPNGPSVALAGVIPNAPSISTSVSMPYAAQTTFTQMTGLNATVVGTVHMVSLAPACSQSNPPCALPNSVIFYLTTNGHTYRLLFVNGSPVTSLSTYNGREVTVNGLVVIPSSISTSEWALPPPLYFDGDIYVRSIVYYLPLQ